MSQVSKIVFAIVSLGQVMSSHHSDQMSQRSQVSRILMSKAKVENENDLYPTLNVESEKFKVKNLRIVSEDFMGQEEFTNSIRSFYGANP